MDRSKGAFIKNPENKIRIAVGILAVFFTVGFFGIASPSTHEKFISLTTVALTLSLLFILIFHKIGNLRKEIIWLILVFATSFLVEMAGVSTGRIFGKYSYGSGLGIKLHDTPLIIGANWILLIYCTAAIADKLSVPDFARILISSSLMLIYDIILEQVAPEMNMWSFDNGTIPAGNYIAWFLLSVIFHSSLRIAGVKMTSRIAPAVFLIHLIFFISLAIFFSLAS